jgi:hypothetical protein
VGWLRGKCEMGGRVVGCAMASSWEVEELELLREEVSSTAESATHLRLRACVSRCKRDRNESAVERWRSVKIAVGGYALIKLTFTFTSIQLYMIANKQKRSIPLLRAAH